MRNALLLVAALLGCGDDDGGDVGSDGVSADAREPILTVANLSDFELAAMRVDGDEYAFGAGGLSRDEETSVVGIECGDHGVVLVDVDDVACDIGTVELCTRWEITNAVLAVCSAVVGTGSGTGTGSGSGTGSAGISTR